jgi:hypothetical protein
VSPLRAAVFIVSRMSLFSGCRSISKVGVRSPNQRQDVNLTVAWWGNARANAV